MISTISYKETLHKLKEAEHWLNSLGIETVGTRFGELGKNIEIINSEYQRGNIDNLRTIMRLDVAYYSLTESQAFISIYEAFKNLNPNHLPKRKLKSILEGPFFSGDEISGDANVNPRNILFEIELAARFIKSGFEVFGFEDLIFRFDRFKVYVQCKRPNSGKSLKTNIETAYRQLKSKEDIFKKNARGMIAIAADKLFGIDTKILPVEHEREIDREVNARTADFVKLSRSAWRGISNQQVLAILLVFKFMALVKPMELLTSVHFINGIPLFPGGISNQTNTNLLKNLAERLKDRNL
jgi:hypothetical protein